MIDACGRIHEWCVNSRLGSRSLYNHLRHEMTRPNLIPKQPITANTEEPPQNNLHSKITRILRSSVINIRPKPKWSYSGMSRIHDMVDVLCSSMWSLMWWVSTTFARGGAWNHRPEEENRNPLRLWMQRPGGSCFKEKLLIPAKKKSHFLKWLQIS